ncbi:hypothetical protein [Methyloceanibacter caenitepidi]|uniref:Uncharacterized protein n=1 Tax=Methyloceanibacter caenitepidi TaxID=1384459 RepID=A0A0A8K319_9HYPH|nr:hypothetical protein [Methyloceanibacter caenitepidi]BAQ17353.1 hypothetical protein GL4_1902 [Methyloceanibacter caenitepidi]
MAQHNPQSRGYLLIVLAAIVVCFVIAQLILGGGESDTHTATDAAGSHQAEASDPAHEETMSEEVPPRMQMGGGMDDGVSPPDEMQDDSTLDGAPKENP